MINTIGKVNAEKRAPTSIPALTARIHVTPRKIIVINCGVSGNDMILTNPENF
ncbi:MAG: hypothetical protein Q8942_11745 [Bacillota bacterium]|nr:hypothetical protein [Bacillota bacterium]